MHGKYFSRSSHFSINKSKHISLSRETWHSNLSFFLGAHMCLLLLSFLNIETMCLIVSMFSANIPRRRGRDIHAWAPVQDSWHFWLQRRKYFSYFSVERRKYAVHICLSLTPAGIRCLMGTEVGKCSSYFQRLWQETELLKTVALLLYVYGCSEEKYFIRNSCHAWNSLFKVSRMFVNETRRYK